MKKVFSDKKTILIVILGIITAILTTILISQNSIKNIYSFNFWLFLLILIGIYFISSFFLYSPKVVGEFIFKNRYKLALIIYIIIVLGKFNGSSANLWNLEIQPSEDFSSETIIGVGRGIRSDEWLVNTPYSLSQKYNNYKYFSYLARGEKTDMYSTIFTPVADIIILARPFNIGYLLFGESYGLSIYWYGRLIALFLVTFEFLLLITNNKKINSLIGALIVTGSPVIQWFYSTYIVELLISGQLCLLLFDKYLCEKSSWKKLLYSILIAFAFNWFALTIYPAWQIPLGYTYVIFAIWILKKNWQSIKGIGDFKYFIITFIIIGLIIGRYLYLGLDTIKIVLSTVYPGSRDTISGGAAYLNFVYPFSIFFPISNYMNPCEASGVYSLFPIPIICSLGYLIKHRNKDKSPLLLLTILSLIYSIYTMIELPSIISKLTLLNISTSQRIMPILEIICCYIMILMIGKIKFKKGKVLFIIGSILASIIIVYFGNKNNLDYGTTKKIICATIVLSIAIYLFVTSSHKINYILFCILAVLLSLENILIINPINKEIKALHNKDVAKEINRISKEDSSAKWIALNSITLPNYILMNGGSVVNSTNIYPNLALWKKIDEEDQYEDIYNRYAHIEIKLTDEDTNMNLIQADYIELNLNWQDLSKLDIKYILTKGEIEIPGEYINEFTNIYHKDNMWIYEYNN